MWATRRVVQARADSLLSARAACPPGFLRASVGERRRGCARRAGRRCSPRRAEGRGGPPPRLVLEQRGARVLLIGVDRRDGRGESRARAEGGPARLPVLRGQPAPLGLCPLAGAAAGRLAATAAPAAGHLPAVPGDPRAVALLDAAAPPRRGRGDRRGDRLEGGGRRSPSDRRPPRPAAGDGARLAAALRRAGRASAGGLHRARLRARPLALADPAAGLAVRGRLRGDRRGRRGRRFGVAALWQFAAAASGGGLLCNTS